MNTVSAERLNSLLFDRYEKLATQFDDLLRVGKAHGSWRAEAMQAELRALEHSLIEMIARFAPVARDAVQALADRGNFSTGQSWDQPMAPPQDQRVGT